MPLPFKQFLHGAPMLLVLLIHAESDDQSGFISIDCGLQQNSGYEEKTTKINYISDETFVDTGENKQILPSEKNNRQQPYWSLRSFRQGTRNCYRINVTSGTKYLIRASFYYGNYDDQRKLPEFGLHLGPNLWDLVQIVNQSIITNKELIHIPLRNYLHICVVNTGSGVPFVSSIELRPLPNDTYQTQTGSLGLVGRFDFGQIRPNLTGYRYPYDVHDRLWIGYEGGYRQLMTTSSIDDNDKDSYKAPSIVMSTAATPKNAQDPLNVWWENDDNNGEYYVYMHFAEVEKLQPNQSRVQYITRNGKLVQTSFSPRFLYKQVSYTEIAYIGGPNNFSIVKAANSTLPPILNAIELYKVKQLIQSETNQEDFDAMTNIKSSYQIQRNWQGDPCTPLAYLWEGLNCSYPEDNNKPPRIISLNLSSSGLTGEIALSLSNLAMIETLDLSNNKLTGPIPQFLSQLQQLKLLSLAKNKFTGSVPAGLVERRKDGSLLLSLCENQKLSGTASCKKEKRSLVIPIVVSLVGVSILALISLAAIWLWGFKRKTQHDSSKPSVELESKKREFTYSEILKISNNFETILGKGGFGTVYHGNLDATHQVAIKMATSVQGFQQFHAEVKLLMRVYHKNLTSLVGYCNDGVHVGLVYEYMANGNLQQHLSGSSSNVLTWEDKLLIATDAAQGLEYLHYGCKPPIIHRDVKSSNILLNENFQAKLSDFGLSRIFGANDVTHVSTVVAGTKGYLDPEYYKSSRLNEKSDVYSFGVVLLEIITSRPAISKTEEGIHISQWVEFMVGNGDINNIVDPRLEGDFNVNSVWKAVEIAMACVSANSSKRPSMGEVVVDLKECLATQLAHTKQSSVTDFVSSNSFDISIPSPR